VALTDDERGALTRRFGEIQFELDRVQAELRVALPSALTLDPSIGEALKPGDGIDQATLTKIAEGYVKRHLPKMAAIGPLSDRLKVLYREAEEIMERLEIAPAKPGEG
jgi:hypothetical protein